MKPTSEEAPAFMTRPRLAKELGLSVRYIQILEKRKILPVYRFGRKCVRYDLNESLEALRKFRIGSKLEGKEGR